MWWLVSRDRQDFSRPSSRLTVARGVWECCDTIRTVAPKACRVLRIGCLAGPAGDVRTHGMRGNTLQLLIEIAAVS